MKWIKAEKRSTHPTSLCSRTKCARRCPWWAHGPVGDGENTHGHVSCGKCIGAKATSFRESERRCALPCACFLGSCDSDFVALFFCFLLSFAVHFLKKYFHLLVFSSCAEAWYAFLQLVNPIHSLMNLYICAHSPDHPDPDTQYSSSLEVESLFWIKEMFLNRGTFL